MLKENTSITSTILEFFLQIKIVVAYRVKKTTKYITAQIVTD